VRHTNYLIEFMDGTEKTVAGFSANVVDGILDIRTSDRVYGQDDYAHFPVANIKTWRQA
jgi:hypothetical protein